MGLLLSPVLAAVCAWRGWSMWYILPGACLAALLSWLGFFRSRWMAIQEAVLLPGSGFQPTFEPEPERVRIEVIEPGEYQAGEYLDLPVDGERLRELAAGIVRGDGLTVHRWSGGVGATFTRSEYERLRARLLAAGLIRWGGDSHQAGMVVTSRGKRVFQELASSPTLRRDDEP